MSPHHSRSPTFPLYHSTRKKPRRWPLVLRFIKGAIHVDIAIPVVLHAVWSAIIVYVDRVRDDHIGLPSSIIPSLSIVVGLMLVFRNQTSYDRFWQVGRQLYFPLITSSDPQSQGNQHITTVTTCIRNLTRSFLSCSHLKGKRPSEEERADTEQTVRLLLAMVYAAKNHLRAEWGMTSLPFLSSKTAGDIERRRRESTSVHKPEYADLLPPRIRGFEDQGLGLLLQLSLRIEGYIKRGYDRGWFHAPQASQLTVQLNQLVSAYGSLETIHLTPLPVAYLIHMRQVLALFGGVLPFALVEEMGWWTILLTSLVTFTLYGKLPRSVPAHVTMLINTGIEAIGAQVSNCPPPSWHTVAACGKTFPVTLLANYVVVP